jgi:hypothetical protein
LVNYAKPNQEIDFVRYNREFVITVIVITEFDCICNFLNVQADLGIRGRYIRSFEREYRNRK